MQLLKKQIIAQKNRNKQMLYQVEMDMVNGNILITQMLQFQLIMAETEEAEMAEEAEDLQDQIMETMQIIHLILIIV